MRQYSGPFGNRLPALEQNILKRRAMEMALILFHAEDLRRAIIGPVRSSGHLMAQLKGDPSLDILPQGTKDEFKKAAQKLVKDGVISQEEAKEIRSLIDYRNVVAHDIQHLTLDLSNDRYVRETLPYRPKNEKRYDAKALQRLKHFNREITKRTWSRYAVPLDMAALEFRAAEATFEAEIQRLNRKIKRQTVERRKLVEQLQSECSLKGLGLAGDLYPRDIRMKYDGGRLTARGIEIMFRLFDHDRSAMAVSIIMDVTVETVRRRYQDWLRAGGKERLVPDFDVLPTRAFYAPRRHSRG